MLKKWMAFLTAILLIFINVIPASAENKKVNNDREAQDPFFVSDCDDAYDWIASEGVEVAGDFDVCTEGGHSVAFTKDFTAFSNAAMEIRGFFDAVDLQNVDYITFDFYISDPELFDAAYQCVVSVGSGDSFHEWVAAMFEADCEEGWNTVTLPLSGTQMALADLKKVDNFRLVFNSINFSENVDDLTIRIDNIRAQSYGTRAITVLDCDDIAGWTSLAGIETENHTQGGCALIFQTVPVTAGGNGSIIASCNFPVLVDGSNADYLEFDLFVSDAYALRPENCLGYGRPHEFYFEITSSGQCDYEEYSWTIQTHFGELKDGWNHIKFPIKGADISNGAPDMRRLNYFRFFFLEMQTCRDNLMTIMIDNIYLSVIQDGIDDYQPEPKPDDNPEENPDLNPDPDPDPNPDQNQGGTPDNTPDDQPSDPNAGNTENEDNEKIAARRALTKTRAKAVVLVLLFAIIGVNFAVIVMQKRMAAEVPSEMPTTIALETTTEPRPFDNTEKADNSSQSEENNE